MAEIEVRVANAADMPGVAGFRWDEGSQDGEGRAQFVADFVSWAVANPNHHCIIALDGRAIVGMAWLAVLPRVPGVGNFHRAGGDIQTVFVLPEYRRRGIGAALLSRIENLTTDGGLSRVTVHSSTMGIPLYERAGFSVTPKLLSREPER